MHSLLVIGMLAIFSVPVEQSADSLVEVTFVVGTPVGPNPDPEQIYCVLSNDGWNPQGRPVKRVAPQLYVGTLRLPNDQTLEYKWVREPRWSAVEKTADGNERANRRLKVMEADGPTTVVQRIERWADLVDTGSPRLVVDIETAPTTQAVRSTITGNVRFHPEFPSTDHPHKRTLRVYVPPGYDSDTQHSYPVLYMHDGQNLFDAATSFSGVEWGVDETAEKMIGEGRIPPVIVVGIDNTPERTAEYTPFPDDRHGGGRADPYLDFVIKVVKPFIDRTYRTRPEREHTAMAGASLGGLVSLYGVMRYGETLGSGAALSTSLMWGDWGVVRYAENFSSPCPNRLWVDVDDPPSTPARLLGEERALAENLRRIRAAFESQGCGGTSAYRFEQPPGPHHESAWAERFDEVLTHLFPRQ